MEITKSKIDFQELLVNLLSRLSEREQEILKQRYQLTNELEKSATLKEIGDVYKITRERVRQIERESIAKLVELKKTKDFQEQILELEVDLVNYLEQKGGLQREDALITDYVSERHVLDFFRSNAYLFVVEYLFDNIDRIQDHQNFYNIWKLVNLDLDKVQSFLSKIEATVVQENRLYKHEEILNLGEKHLSVELRATINKFLEKHSQLELKHILESYLSASTDLEQNILGSWGCAHWSTVRPKKLSDKIELIFQKEKNPLHFREIAEKINQSKFDQKKICAATIHNELIANDKYVLIGRGIYALKDWGYESGTVTDIIKRILESSSKPLTKEEIYEKVLNQRKVNKSTIYLTLINKDKFDRIGANYFANKS